LRGALTTPTTLHARLRLLSERYVLVLCPLLLVCGLSAGSDRPAAQALFWVSAALLISLTINKVAFLGRPPARG
jgi:hypothetical protein